MEQIVEEVLHGERGAATRFYKTYAPAVRRYLLAKLPDEHTVANILQDVFLSAFDSLALYRGDSSVSTWLYSIARHEVADFYRKQYVRKVIERTSPLFENIVSEVLSPEFTLRKKKLRAKFMGAYTGLSRDYQDILSDRYELGMSVKEIAAKMELSFKATESLLYRARKAFAVAYGYEQI